MTGPRLRPGIAERRRRKLAQLRIGRVGAAEGGRLCGRGHQTRSNRLERSLRINLDDTL